MVLWAVPGYLQKRRAALALTQAQPGFTPPLTLLKPLHGAEPGLEAHLATFFEQDYPGIRDSFLRALSRRCRAWRQRGAWRRAIPRIPAKFLSTGGQPDYINAKVASMELMETAAAHEILVISDSDVRVTPDYLRAVALPFADRAGGRACAARIAAWRRKGGLWARLEAVGMSVEMTSGVLAARAMEGMQFVLGPTMAFRRETIRRMGGFQGDGRLLRRRFCAGQRDLQAGPDGGAEPPCHRPHGHQLELAGFTQAPGALDEVHAVFAAQGPLRHRAHVQCAVWAAGVGSCCIGWGTRGGDWRCWAGAWRRGWRWRLAVGRLVVCDRSWFGLLVLYPLRDLMGFGFWAASYWGSRILWRGRVFELLPGGKMREAQLQSREMTRP